MPSHPVCNVLTKPIVIESRKPLRFSEEFIETDLAPDIEHLLSEEVMAIAKCRRAIFKCIPFLFEVLFKEIAVGDVTEFRPEFLIGREKLPVLKNHPSTRCFLRHKPCAVATEGVEPFVVKSPCIEVTVSRSTTVQGWQVVTEVCSECESSIAQVVG